MMRYELPATILALWSVIVKEFQDILISMHWLHFFLLVAVQLLFFLFVAYIKRTRGILNVLLKSIPIGIVLGMIFDLVVGKYTGIFGYVLGFDLPFLIVNGIFSWGVMLATISLFENKMFWSLYGWTVILGIVCEIANYFFPVWVWQFPAPFSLREAVVIFVMYPALCSTYAILSRYAYKKHKK